MRPQTHSQSMAESKRRLNRRDKVGVAAALAVLAANQATTPEEAARAYNQAGICLRLLKIHEQSLWCFDQAETCASLMRQGENDDTQRVLTATITRDRGMLHCDTGDIQEALADIDRSLQLLNKDQERVDWLNSRGFRGRALLMADPIEARSLLLEAADGLRALPDDAHEDIRVFELNAIVWAVKSLGRQEAKAYLRRGFELARQQRCRPRLVELGVLAAGGMSLHRRLDRWH